MTGLLSDSDLGITPAAQPALLSDSDVGLGPAAASNGPQYARQPVAAQRDQPQYARDATDGPSGFDRFARQVRSGEYNAIGSTVGRALDVVPYFVGQALGYDDVHPVERAIRSLGGEAPEPQSYGERVANATGRFMGENLPVAAGITGLAQSGTRFVANDVAPGIANMLKAGTNRVLDAIARNPAKTAALETIASADAGAGGQIAKETAEGAGYGPAGQRVAETFGQLTAPTVGDYLPTMLGIRAAAPIFRAGRSGVEKVANTVGEAIPENYRPAWLDDLAQSRAKERMDTARGTVGDQLRDTLSQPEAHANVAEAQRLEAEIPGFQPGIARASGDQNLINTQRQLDTEATGPALRERQQATDASTQAIRDYLERGAPPLQGMPQDAVARSVASRVQGDQRAAAQQSESVRGQIRSQSDALPEIDRAQAGQTLRDIRAQERAAADREVQRLRANIGAPETPVRVGDETITLDEALNRRAAINQELRDYSSATARNVADVQRMRQLAAQHDALDAAVDSVNAPGLREYRDYYREQYAPRFLEGASRDIGRYDQFGYGKNKVAAEDVSAKWFAPNSISEARQFNAVYGNNPAARQAMTDYALDDLRHSAVDPSTGLIKQGAVNRWLAKNERVLNEMPWARDAVATRNPDALYARLGQLEQRQRQIADTKVAGLLGKNPEQMIDAGLNDWQAMRGLKRSVRGDDRAEAALTRAVWDRAVKAAGPDTLVNADKLQSWIDDHRRALNEVLTPAHLKNLETVIQAARVQARAPRPTGTVATPLSIPGAVGAATGVTVPSAVGSALSIARGRTSPWTEVPMQAVKFWNRQKDAATKAAWDEALSNPDVAKALANVVKTGATPLKIRKLYAYLVTAGAIDREQNWEPAQ
jgi:hypothetical protein